MKVRQLIQQLQLIDPEYDVNIVDSDESARAKYPFIKLEVSKEEQLCLLHYSCNFRPENMENWFSNE